MSEVLRSLLPMLLKVSTTIWYMQGCRPALTLSELKAPYGSTIKQDHAASCFFNAGVKRNALKGLHERGTVPCAVCPVACCTVAL